MVRRLAGVHVLREDCGGVIEAASQVWPDFKAPYLKGHDDPYCRKSGWTSSIPKQELRNALAASGIQSRGGSMQCGSSRELPQAGPRAAGRRVCYFGVVTAVRSRARAGMEPVAQRSV